MITGIHSQGIIHSDIKSENILIADDGTPRICDFEMSKDLASMSISIAAGGGGFTPGFMCPRVLNRTATLSSASDMYAFGVLLLNTVHPPAEGEDYPLKDTTKLTDMTLKGLVQRLLSEDPAVRPSAVELQAQPFFALALSDSVDEWGRVDAGQYASQKTCRQEMLDADPAALQVPQIASIVLDVDWHMKKLKGLTDTQANHRFAFFMYTMESPVYLLRAMDMSFRYLNLPLVLAQILMTYSLAGVGTQS